MKAAVADGLSSMYSAFEHFYIENTLCKSDILCGDDIGFTSGNSGSLSLFFSSKV